MAAPLRWRQPIRPMMAGVTVVAIAGGLLASCGHGDPGRIGRLVLDGQVLVTPAHKKQAPAHSGLILFSGDQVEVTSGNASIRLDPKGLLELRTGTHLMVNRVPHLTAGAILIEPDRSPVRVSAGDVTLTVPSGVGQLAVASGVAATVYQGASRFELPGNPPLTINAPRRANLTDKSVLPLQALPIQYQENDAWDRRYLAAIESFASQLNAAATGFNAQLAAGQGHDAAFYKELLPSLAQRSDFDPAFDVVQQMQPLGTGAPAKAGDYLIATVIAMRGTRNTFVERLREELIFMSQGADWGMVAYDQGVDDLAGILSDVLAAIGRAPLPFAQPPSAQVANPRSTPSNTTLPSTGRFGGPGQGTSPPTTRPRSPGRTPSTTATTAAPLLRLPVLPRTGTPLDPLLDPVLDPLIQALNRILAGLG